MGHMNIHTLEVVTRIFGHKYTSDNLLLVGSLTVYADFLRIAPYKNALYVSEANNSTRLTWFAHHRPSASLP
jgi:hypothetical protein